jgi:hypothetical protein
VLIRVQSGMNAKLRTDTGVWLEKFITTAGTPETSADGSMMMPAAETRPGPAQPGALSPEAEMFRKRYGLDMASPMPAAEMPSAPPPAYLPDGTIDPNATAATGSGNTNEIGTITLTFRAISLSSVSAAANTETAFAVLNEIKNSPLFDPGRETDFAGNISPDEPPGTYTFSIKAKLKRPLKL